MARATLAALTILALLPHPLAAQVTFERLLDATDEPHNWLTYSGNYDSNRHTTLDQITVDNVDRLELQWVLQAQSLQVFQTTPLVVDGIMYITEAPNTVLALDAELGRVFWRYEYTPAQESRPCCGRVNRGVAILGETLFMGTIDAQLIAIDAVSGRPIWQTSVAEPGAGYALTLAPLIVKDKVIVSVAGGEYGIRGFISAYDPETGEEEWRFYTIPGPGEPGHDTWQGDDWRYGGASAWITGSYDPDVDLIYWGIGNPGPDWNPSQRPGDNLYSDSVVALDPDTGELEWYFQFTPNDPYDYDSVQVPVLVDFPTQDGGTLKLMLWGNRNGFFYVLDSRERTVHQRAAFHRTELGRGTRRQRASDLHSAGTGGHDVSGRAGRHQLVLPVLQSVDAPVLPVGLGGIRFGLRGAGSGVRRRTSLPRRPAGPTGTRRRTPEPRAGTDQHVDRSGRQRRRHRHRPGHRRAGLEVRDDGRHEQRHPDHRHRHPLHRQPRGLLPRLRRPGRRAALAENARRDDRQRPDQLRRRRPAARRGGGR